MVAHPCSCNGAARRFLQLLVLQRLVAILRVVEDCDAGERRNEFLEHLKPFAGQLGRNAGQPGRFTTGSCDARDETVQWVARGNDNGYGGGCFLGCPQALIAGNEQQVYIEAGELMREFGEAIKIALRPSGFDGDVFSLDIAQFAARSLNLTLRVLRTCLQVPG